MSGLTKVVVIWAITAVAVALTVTVLPGLNFAPSDLVFSAPGIFGSDVLVPTLIFSAVLALVNAFIKPIAKLITFPLTILTLGLFSILLNVLLFYLVSWISSAFFAVALFIDNFWTALIASFLIGLVVAILSAVFGVDSDDKRKKRQDRR